MAVAAVGAASKTSLALRRPLIFCASRARRRSSAAALITLSDPDCQIISETRDPDSAPPPPPPPPPNGRGVEGTGAQEWKMVSSKELGIKNSMIARPTRSVLNGLRKKGFDAYLVGGCVRDLIMKKIPKDFDIITTANLREVQKIFSRCDIVGKRFPICHVHVNNYIVEVRSFILYTVSSFKTCARKSKTDHSYTCSRPPECDEHDYLRWRNCLARDFTINGMMFNPYSNLVYDYLGGMEDLKKAKVRTVIPAYISFEEDSARILRAVRIAARLGFRFTKETAHSLKDLATSVLKLDKGRLLMEMNYMLAYGSAEASLRLLWRFGLLELLLPIQAAYFVSQGFRRRDKRTNMLLALFSNLDRLLAPDRPCHNSLWVGILAFHQALVRTPRDPLVVATFTLALHTGGDLLEAVNIARRVTHPHETGFSELLEPQGWDKDEDLLDEVQDLASSVNAALSSMTDEYFVSQAMARYPQAPFSDLVIIPLQVYLKVCRMFECIGSRVNEGGFTPKQGSKINYGSLVQGDLAEVRHVFARVVFDTAYPPNMEQRAIKDPA